MKSSNVDKMVIGMNRVPSFMKKPHEIALMKKHARRSYRREANRNARMGDDESIPSPKLTDWDVW